MREEEVEEEEVEEEEGRRRKGGKEQKESVSESRENSWTRLPLLPSYT